MQKEHLISQTGESFVDILYRERLEFEQVKSKQFYSQYKAIRIELFEHLRQEQAEWLQYFNDQKQEAMSIQSSTKKTDNEIDKMVYELYELTDEEIRIVENIE